MPRCPPAVIPAAPRKTLLEWIASDDGDTTGLAPPACSPQVRSLHAHLVRDPRAGGTGRFEPLVPPPGLRLAPLG